MSKKIQYNGFPVALKDLAPIPTPVGAFESLTSLKCIVTFLIYLMRLFRTYCPYYSVHPTNFNSLSTGFVLAFLRCRIMVYEYSACNCRRSFGFFINSEVSLNSYKNSLCSVVNVGP